MFPDFAEVLHVIGNVELTATDSGFMPIEDMRRKLL